MRIAFWNLSLPASVSGNSRGALLLAAAIFAASAIHGSVFTSELRAGPNADATGAAASELATIRAAYQSTHGAIQGGDLQLLAMEFDRVLPGSGPQRVQARFYFNEGYAEDAPTEERRFYFDAVGKAVHRIYGPAGAKAQALALPDA
ncbi:MAG: hypothetical protein NXI24_18245 [bacterium]|nr:hypothetical protein [bacterium]